MSARGHQVGDASTAQAIAHWLLVPSPLKNMERPSRETVESYGHRVLHAEGIARLRELRADLAERSDTGGYRAEVAFHELAGFDRALRALGLEVGTDA